MNTVRQDKFDGRDLCVVERHVAGDSSGVLTFGPWLQNPLGTRSIKAARGFGEGVFTPSGVDEFHVIPRRNHWYQSPEMDEVRRLAEEFSRSRNVVTYGASMGAYGASLLSAWLDVPAIALAPQFSLDQMVAPWEVRWREDARAIAAFDNDAMTRNGRARGYLFYDPFTGLDALQAGLFRGKTDFEFIPCPFAGHGITSKVNEIYSLRRLVLEVIGGIFSRARFQSVRRSSQRGNDGLYVAMLYVQAVLRRKHRVSTWAESRLHALKEQLGAKAVRTMYMFERRRRNFDQAKNWSRIAASMTPQTAGECFIAAQVASGGGFVHDARRILQYGLTLEPGNAVMRRQLQQLD